MKEHKTLHIICEGLDRCGKSTLTDKLIKYYKLPFLKLHFYAPPFKDIKQNVDFEVKLYSDMLKAFNSFEYVISDRSHLGSLVYSPMYRSNDGAHTMFIEKNLPENTFLITLIDDVQNLLNRDDGLSFTIDAKQKQKEIDLFKEAHNSSSITNKLIINIKDKDAEAVFKEVTEFIDSKYNS